jgi:hypothetical protein
LNSKPLTKERLAAYTSRYLKAYRETVEKWFHKFGEALPRYRQSAYRINYYQIGDFGVIVGYSPAEIEGHQFWTNSDFEPPLTTINIVDLTKYWDATWTWFDLSGQRSFSEDEAIQEGVQQAISDALDLFWGIVPQDFFERFCLEMLTRQSLTFYNSVHRPPPAPIVSLSSVKLDEPAHFLRTEEWAFAFEGMTNSSDHRVTESVRALERLAETEPFDVLCLVTSQDLTSIGKHVAVANPKIRVWDRSVLRRLVNDNLSVIAK